MKGDKQLVHMISLFVAVVFICVVSLSFAAVVSDATGKHHTSCSDLCTGEGMNADNQEESKSEEKHTSSCESIECLHQCCVPVILTERQDEQIPNDKGCVPCYNVTMNCQETVQSIFKPPKEV